MQPPTATPTDAHTTPHTYAATFGPGWYDHWYRLGWDHAPASALHGVRQGAPVVSAAGYEIGRVDGLVADSDGVTHLVLERGHVFGPRDVVVPIAYVQLLADHRVRVRLCRDEIDALPEVSLEIITGSEVLADQAGGADEATVASIGRCVVRRPVVVPIRSAARNELAEAVAR